jgi:hypothetical protein
VHVVAFLMCSLAFGLAYLSNLLARNHPEGGGEEVKHPVVSIVATMKTFVSDNARSPGIRMRFATSPGI